MALPRLVAFDFETTGLDPSNDSVVEIGAVEFDIESGERGDSFSLLVSPGRPIPLEAYRKHKISDAMVADAPPAADGINRLIEWIGNDAIVFAHNAAFDLRFIVAHCKRESIQLPGWSAVDTLSWARLRLKGKSSYKLDRLVPTSQRRSDAHRALSDALAATELARQIARGYKSPASAIRRRSKPIRQVIESDRQPGPVSASGVAMMTSRQASYLVSLGANEKKIRGLTRAQASTYIDQLKRHQKSATGGGSGCMVSMALIGLGVLAIAVAIEILL